MSQNYYETLGVEKSASPNDIKGAFRKQALKYHPDRNQGDIKSEEMFKKINDAYSILGDPEKKRMYDSGVDPNQQRPGSSGFGGFGRGHDPFADLFSQFSGFERMHRQESRQQPKIINVVIKINLYESVFGTERNIKFNYNDVCKTCKGSGVKEWETCNVCNGSGMRTAQQGPNSHIMMPCMACHGTGKISKVRCDVCGGGGITGIKTKELTVNIKPGIMPGESIIIRDGGIPDISGNPGPLVVNIETIFPNASSFSDEDKDILQKLLNK